MRMAAVADNEDLRLEGISASGLTAAEVVGHITSRKRNRRVDTVRRLHQVCSSGTSRQSVVNVLRQLEAGGFETFINGLRAASASPR